MSTIAIHHEHQGGSGAPGAELRDIRCLPHGRGGHAGAETAGELASYRQPELFAPNQLSRGSQVPGAFHFPRVFLLRQQLPLALTRQLGIERATALCHFHSRAGFRRGANIPCKPFEHIRQDRSEGLSSHLPFLSQRPSPDSHDAIEKDLTYAQRFFASGAKADD